MTAEQAEARFGKEAINKLIDMQVEPTSRLIYPAYEPQHAGMDEYCAGGVYVDGGKIYAYYYQPTGTDDWGYGEMNGIQYGDIEFIEYIEC